MNRGPTGPCEPLGTGGGDFSGEFVMFSKGYTF